MALVDCKECGKSVSDAAKSCPSCGKELPKPMGRFRLAVILVFLASIGSAMMGKSSPPAAAANSPAPVAAPSAEAVAKEASFQKVVQFARLVKASLKDPESVAWANIMANDDASVICLEYRARNSYGAMSKESASYVNGASSQKPSVWNRHCAGRPLNDMGHATYALK